jgi:hypothetical protein
MIPFDKALIKLMSSVSTCVNNMYGHIGTAHSVSVCTQYRL